MVHTEEHMKTHLGLVLLAGIFFSATGRCVPQQPKERATLEHGGHLCRVAARPDGKVFVTGGEYGILQLWDLATRREWATLQSHDGWLTSVAFSPDGRML